MGSKLEGGLFVGLLRGNFFLACVSLQVVTQMDRLKILDIDVTDFIFDHAPQLLIVAEKCRVILLSINHLCGKIRVFIDSVNADVNRHDYKVLALRNTHPKVGV